MDSRPIGIICHGGAGVIADKTTAAEGLRPAIEEGYRLLRQSASAQEALVTAVRLLEDSGVFNAGATGDLTIDGRAEVDAALALQDGRFGAVACVSGVRNPVLLAERVLLDTDHVLMCGEGAAEFARTCGLLDGCGPSERGRTRLARVLAEGSPYLSRLPGTADTGGGTVGAVAFDRKGRLAAATSTGGLAGRMRGRVSDAAVIGAGTFAGPSGAVSCTGHGEEIMRRMLGRDIVDRMQTLPGSVAMTLVVADARRRKARVGAVGLDARCGVCWGHTTPDMAWGYKVAERLFMFTEEKQKR